MWAAFGDTLRGITVNIWSREAEPSPDKLDFTVFVLKSGSANRVSLLVTQEQQTWTPEGNSVESTRRMGILCIDISKKNIVEQGYL